MAGFPGGAGDLGSYMGGGGEHETSSQSTTAGNGQAILLLFVACIACTALLGIRFKLDEASKTNKAYTNNDSGRHRNSNSKRNKATYVDEDEDDQDEDHDSSTESKSSKSKRRKYYYDSDAYDDDTSEEASDYNSLDDLALDQLFENLASTKTWVKVGDDDLILKVLENKTFENSIEDDFDAEVVKISDLTNGHAEYSISIAMKEKVSNGQLYILGITTYDVDGEVTEHEVPNTNSKMFSIIASKRLKEVRIKTYTGNVVTFSGDIKIGNIVKQTIQNREYLFFDVSGKYGVNKVELLDNNNTIKAVFDYNSGQNHFQVDNKEGVTKVRLTDENGFVEEKTI